MLRPWLYIGSMTLCLTWADQSAQASNINDGTTAATTLTTPAATASSTPAGQTTTVPSTTSFQSGPSTSAAVVAAPPPTSPVDAGSNRKFYTISASLREIYDNNVLTATTGRQSSFETEISPSILFDFPAENNDFSLRETFTATYYTNRPGSSPFDFSNEVVAQYQHSFSDRFSMNVADQFRYYEQPSLFDNIGTLYYNGAYFANTFNGSFNAQWTPLVSTLFTYANTYVDYVAAATAAGNNSVENTGSATLGFAILPKITLNFSGIIDDISYTQIARGYTSYTGTTGVNWAALPSLNVNASLGASTTQTELNSTGNISPYGALSISWQLGARSAFNFNYSHSVVPTDVVQSEGQIADRIGTSFTYNILPSLGVHLDGTYTHGQYTSWLLQPNTINAFSENDFAIDAGLTYHINSHFDANLGNTYSGVASGLSFRDYNRDQVYMGVRGTY